MAAQTVDLLSVGTATNTRTLLRVIILSLIAAAAIASRLFSVIRKYPPLRP
jgi:dolichyl-diphosphooligosaccharide---protein glycosyltransferase